MTLLMCSLQRIRSVMEIESSSASPTAPYRNCSSFHDSDDDVINDISLEPRSSPAAAAATASCYGDTTPPSSPASQVDDVKPRLYLTEQHHYHHRQRHHHSDTLSPHLAVSKLQQPPARARCALDVSSIIATDNKMTFVDNR